MSRFESGGSLDLEIAAILCAGLFSGASTYVSFVEHPARLSCGTAPFTLVVILPTNRRLLKPTLDPDSPDAVVLMRRWGDLHAVRTALGLLAFVILVVCIAQS